MNAYEQMKATGILRWRIAGVETDACVLACAFALWDAGMVPEVDMTLSEGPLRGEALSILERSLVTRALRVT